MATTDTTAVTVDIETLVCVVVDVVKKLVVSVKVVVREASPHLSASKQEAFVFALAPKAFKTRTTVCVD